MGFTEAKKLKLFSFKSFLIWVFHWGSQSTKRSLKKPRLVKSLKSLSRHFSKQRPHLPASKHVIGTVVLDDAEAIQWGETDHDPYLSSYKKRRPSTPFYRVFQVCSIFAATFLSLWNSLDLDIWHPVTRENQLNLQHDTWEKDVLERHSRKCSTKRMKFISSKKVSGAESLSKQLKVDTFPRMTAAAKCHF